jgi:hypothetical protein
LVFTFLNAKSKNLAMVKKYLVEARAEIIGGLTVALILGVIAWIFSEQAKTVGLAVWGFLISVWNHITSNMSLPWWLVYGVGLYISIRIISGFFKFIREESRAAQEQPASDPVPDHAQYTQDIFDDVLWRWKYTPDYQRITDLRAFCPHDDTELTAQSWVTYVHLHCQYCGRDYFLQYGRGIGLQSGLDGAKERVKMLVDRNIRNGEWRTPPAINETGETDQQ